MCFVFFFPIALRKLKALQELFPFSSSCQNFNYLLKVPGGPSRLGEDEPSNIHLQVPFATTLLYCYQNGSQTTKQSTELKRDPGASLHSWQLGDCGSPGISTITDEISVQNGHSRSQRSTEPSTLARSKLQISPLDLPTWFFSRNNLLPLGANSHFNKGVNSKQ